VGGSPIVDPRKPDLPTPFKQGLRLGTLEP
jgi:hypothetical protein